MTEDRLSTIKSLYITVTNMYEYEQGSSLDKLVEFVPEMVHEIERLKSKVLDLEAVALADISGW